MKRNTLLWISVIVITGLLGWKLYVKKQQINRESRMSLVGRQYVPIEVVRPRLENLSNNLETDGIFLPVKEMFVISETQGRVVEVFKNKGEWFKEGEVIAKVDDELLRIELEATQANIAKLKKDKERLDNLIEGDAVPKNKIEDIQLGLLAAEAKEKGLKSKLPIPPLRRQ
ncbi:MAG: hypothetical protein IPL65_01610 [Lewinellaceae bacterium]|nr:hypothetical protein [Lewinellaceae bacterium]